jgi:hypothetical protein
MNNCIGVRNHNVFLMHLLATACIFLMDIIPPILMIIRELIEGDERERREREFDDESFYYQFCFGCESRPISLFVNAFCFLIAVIGSLILLWILCTSLRKFARDGAQLGE